MEQIRTMIENLFLNPLNSSKTICLSNEEEYNKYKVSYITDKKAMCTNVHKIFALDSVKSNNYQKYISLKNEIQHLYYEKEIGLKSLVKMIGLKGLTYTTCRRLFSYLEIPLRNGRSVVTSRVRSIRKEKALIESSTKTGFQSFEVQKNVHSKGITRGIQGFYFNQSRQKYVWLRSSWEYIYAKFLDRIKADWDVEVTHYVLEDGRTYRPDFFIYESNQLVKIVEVKGYEYRPEKMSDLIIKGVDLVLVKNIKLFISEGSTESKEREEWKTIRRTSNEIKTS
jgi:hypothetical protein